MAKKKQNEDQNVVKKVEPIVTDTGDSDAIPRSSGRTGVRGTVSNVLGGMFQSVKNGFSDLKSNFFGLKSVGRVVGSGFEKVGNFLHIPKAAAGVLLVGTVTLGGGAGLLAYLDTVQLDFILRQDGIIEEDCVEEVENMKVSGSDIGDTSGLMREYAEKAWAVGKAIGMTDEQCAGMLGNMQQECSMDPTTIEAIYDEPFNINGPRKSAAASDLCAYCTTTLRQAYINSGWGINAWTTSQGCTMAYASNSGGEYNIASQWYEGTDGHFFPGIGLFGFTGVEGNALVNYAEAGSKDWWDFDLQMAFIIDTTGGYSRATWVESWVASGGPSSPEEAATEWNINFEGNSGDTHGDIRRQNARNWYNELHGTSGDTAYAASIIALADSIQGGALNTSVAQAEDECAEAMPSYDNSNLAKAAVAYAYETTDEGRGNNGTELYQAVHDAVLAPGDTYYMSCDRGVACAVRWSGADDNFEYQGTSSQDVYLASHPEKWEFVGRWNGSDVTFDELQPGDILITTAARRGGSNGHIVMFVGNENVQAKYPGATGNTVSASLNTRSPGCEAIGDGWSVGEGYYVYRNIQPEENPQYIDCVAGMDLDDGT